jgi:hypothetical protein
MPKALPPLVKGIFSTENVDFSTENLTTGKKIHIRALLDAGAPISSICRKQGVTRAQVKEIAESVLLSELSDGKLTSKTKEMLGANFYRGADIMLQEALRPEKVRRLNGKDAMIAAAVAFDKGRLSEGLSTENLSIRGVVGHFQEKIGEADALRNRLLEALEHID